MHMRGNLSGAVLVCALALAFLFGCDESVFIGDSAPNVAPDGAPYRRPPRGGHDELLYQVQLDGKRPRRHRGALRIRHVRRKPGRLRSRRYDGPRRVDEDPLHRQHVRVFGLRERRRGDGGLRQVLLVLPEGPYVLHQSGGRQRSEIEGVLPVVHREHPGPLRRHRNSPQRGPREGAVASLARQVHVEGRRPDRRSLEHSGTRIDPLFCRHPQHEYHR